MLDAKTGMFLWSAETLTLAALLGSLWLHKPANRHNLYFAAGFAMTGIGITMVALRGNIADFLSIEVGNTIALSAFGFWLAGLLRIEGRKIDGWIAIPMLLWIAGMLVSPLRDSMLSRILLYHCSAAIGFFMLAGVLLTHKGHVSNTRKLLACTLVLHAFSGPITASFVIPYNLATGNAVPLTTPLAFLGALGFIAIMMISAKMFMEDSERRLYRLATTDHLTGVLNRRGLIEEFNSIKMRMAVDQKQIALILFDIDHFKKINDKYGHQIGDKVLVHFCEMASRIIEGQGLFVRMGGEEFAVIIETADPAKATTIAEAIRIYLSRAPVSVEVHSVPVTVSVGIASETTATADLNTLLTIADRSLYAAKKSGRNRTVIWDGKNNVVIAADDRPEDPSDNNADRQVAALNRITAIANR